MAKSRQMLVRMDAGLGAALDERSKAMARSRAQLICAAVRYFLRLPKQEQRRVLIESLSSDIPVEDARPSKAESRSARRRAPP